METGTGSRNSRFAWFERRKAKHMAQLLEEFERDVQPLIPNEVAHRFKSTVRRKLNSLGDDVKELVEMDDGVRTNELAERLLDRIFPDGPPKSSRKGIGQ